MNQYRKIYEDYYSTNIPNDFDIHHIDYDHSNNDPNNLVALPKELHKVLHKTYNTLCMWSPVNIVVHTGQVSATTEYINALHGYIHVIEMCTKYMNNRGNNCGK